MIYQSENFKQLVELKGQNSDNYYLFQLCGDLVFGDIFRTSNTLASK